MEVYSDCSRQLIVIAVITYLRFLYMHYMKTRIQIRLEPQAVINTM